MTIDLLLLDYLPQANKRFDEDWDRISKCWTVEMTDKLNKKIAHYQRENDEARWDALVKNEDEIDFDAGDYNPCDDPNNN